MKGWEDGWIEQIRQSWALHESKSAIQVHAVSVEVCFHVTHSRGTACLISVWHYLSAKLIWWRYFCVPLLSSPSVKKSLLPPLCQFQQHGCMWKYVIKSRFCDPSDHAWDLKILIAQNAHSLPAQIKIDSAEPENQSTHSFLSKPGTYVTHNATRSWTVLLVSRVGCTSPASKLQASSRDEERATEVWWTSPLISDA